MAQYNPKSLHAEEFINHEEILETLKYAEENKKTSSDRQHSGKAPVRRRLPPAYTVPA